MEEKQYLSELQEMVQLQERIEIISGVLSMQILREMSGELWYFNMKAGSMWKVKFLKRTFAIHVYNPADLKKPHGESNAGVRNLEAPQHRNRSAVLAEGSAHLLFRMPFKTGAGMFPTIDLYDFDIKGYKKSDMFRVRFEPPAVGPIYLKTSQARIFRIPNLEYKDPSRL